jgi:hypothetical protein
MCGAIWIDLDRKSIILNDDEASKDAGTLCLVAIVCGGIQETKLMLRRKHQ